MKYSTIETDRIVLRFLTHNDIDDMLLYRNNINVSKYQGFEPNYTKEKHERIYKHIFN
jgi:RimJ/RimL family protein N-acetyltransferase